MYHSYVEKNRSCEVFISFVGDFRRDKSKAKTIL